MKDQRKRYSFFKMLLRVIPLQYKTAPWLMTVSNLFVAIQALAFTATVVTTQLLFDTLIRGVEGQFAIWDCVPALLLLAAATFGQQIFNGLYWFFVDVVHQKASGKLKTLLHRKVQRVEPVSFEQTDFLDDFNKANRGVFVITYFCMLFFALIFFYLVYFASIGLYLFRLKPILVITLLLSFLPAMLAQVVRNRVFTRLEQESAPLRREHEYYRKTICDREYFKETRILGAFSFFYQLFSETLGLLIRKEWQAERKTACWQLVLNITTFVGMGISVWLLYTAAMSGEISLGAFAAVFASLGELFGLMQEMIMWHIGNMSKDIGKITNFFRVLDMPERSGGASGYHAEVTPFKVLDMPERSVEGAMPDFMAGIMAEHVSFTYPGSDTPAVDDVSLTIGSGETVAFVGENGAGKTTLVRLLTGIYRPATGRVTAGGQDTAATAPAALFQGISGVFQKFQRYQMTLQENVVISDMNRSADEEKVKAVLQETDAEPDDAVTLNTMLSPEFDGIDLSGGQWQRLAIARGLYRTSGFIVLDEPTSAIDPIEETKIYTQFQRLAKGKCAAIVTHRLGSAKLAHRIIVMDSGKIVDTGTHEELLSRPGKYAEMWASQARWYERE